MNVSFPRAAVSLGGQCDSIDKMLADDPALKRADAALAELGDQ